MRKNKEQKKIEKEINKELKQINEDKKEKKKKRLVRAFKDKENEYRNRKLKYALELTVVVIFSVIMLFLLCNRTFFREEYKTSKIDIEIPMLMLFEKDTGNRITLKTLRKSQYVREYFDAKLMRLTRYNCDGYSFYYDDLTKTAIYNINVEKKWAIKTITIDYAVGNADCLCNVKTTGKSAEKLCKDNI